MIFSHRGDYGDVVYSLMAVRFLCAEADARCTFYLCPDSGTRAVMTREHAEALLPLLREQHYFASAEWRAEPLGVRIDTAQRCFAQHWANLADNYAHYLRVSYSEQQGAWLTVNTPTALAAVVFSRSARYRNPVFPWRVIHRRYGQQAAFLGTPEEHQAFEREVGKVAFAQTATLSEAAQIIAGCQLFCGNQSCLRAIAEGLKVPVCVEVFTKPPATQPDTHFARGDAWYNVPPPENFLQKAT